MKICNAQGCGVCVNCNGIPPTTNGNSHGDICRKVVDNIMNYLEDGNMYTYRDGKLYQVDVHGYYKGSYYWTNENECNIGI